MLIRVVNSDDCFDVLNWRNNFVSRQISLQSNEISVEDHEQWFSTMMACSNHLGYIGQIRDEKIGVIFFKRVGQNANISINMNPLKRGKNLARNFLEGAMVEFKKVDINIECFIAEIKHCNVPSIRLFTNSGFMLHRKQSVSDIYAIRANAIK
jgi:RimJ/RimL family protein N-acetyltransferase